MINPSNPTRPPGITGSPLIGKLWAIIEGEPGQGYDRSERASLTHGEIRALLLELDAAKTDAVPDVKPEMPDLLARSSRTNSNAERRTVSPDDIVAKIDAMLDFITRLRSWWESRADEDQECDAWKWEQALLAASGHGSIP